MVFRAAPTIAAPLTVPVILLLLGNAHFAHADAIFEADPEEFYQVFSDKLYATYGVGLAWTAAVAFVVKLVARLKQDPQTHAQWLCVQRSECVQVAFDGPVRVKWGQSGDAAVVKAVKPGDGSVTPTEIEAGLMLVSVNGVDVRAMKFSEVISTLREAARPLKLEMFRPAAEGSMPTTEEILTAEALVSDVANAVKRSGQNEWVGDGTESEGFHAAKQEALTNVLGPYPRSSKQAFQLTVEATVSKTDREPRMAAMSLATLKAVARCTPGPETSAQALSAAKELLQVTRKSLAKDKVLIKAAHEAGIQPFAENEARLENEKLMANTRWEEDY